MDGSEMGIVAGHISSGRAVTYKRGLVWSKCLRQGESKCFLIPSYAVLWRLDVVSDGGLIFLQKSQSLSRYLACVVQEVHLRSEVFALSFCNPLGAENMLDFFDTSAVISDGFAKCFGAFHKKS